MLRIVTTNDRPQQSHDHDRHPSAWTLEKHFQLGYSEGSAAVDEESRADAHAQGVEDGLSGIRVHVGQLASQAPEAEQILSGCSTFSEEGGLRGRLGTWMGG
jgi:hypothetical protein